MINKIIWNSIVVNSRVSLKLTSKPSANASGFDYILAPSLRVLVSQRTPDAEGLIP
jgi:hypothetical protein